jgi:hypothetical protein
MATSANDATLVANRLITPAIDIIYHNMHAGSDFRTSRGSSTDSLKSNIAVVAKHIKDDCYTVISINISTYSIVVVFSTSLSKAELREKGFPFPIPDGGELAAVEN